MQLFDLGQNFIRPQLATVAARRCPRPMAARSGRSRSISISTRCRRTTCRPRTSSTPSRAEPDPACRHEKIGKFDYNVVLNASPMCSMNSTICRSGRSMARSSTARRGPCARWLAAADEHGPGQRPPPVLMTILKTGAASTLDIIDGIKSLLPRIEESLPAEPQSARRRRSVDIRQGRGIWRHPRGGARRRAGRPDDPAVPRQLAFHGDHPDQIPLAILFSMIALSGSARPSTS